jgi:diketogulonate reductase-like aldo/keto reductase
MKGVTVMAKVLAMALGVLAILSISSCSSTDPQNVTEQRVITEASFDFENRTVTLNNGIEMPILGLGTYRLSPAQAEESVYHALADGYRLIDTANGYMNERAVGRGIQRSGVPREEIFITTKLWPSDYEDVERAIDDTLARLNVEYIDLLLLHQPYGNIVEGYQGMESAVRQGKVRSIGLANFYERRLDAIMSIATILPAVLQNESNPYVQQSVMREYVKSYGTVMMAWYPLGGRVDDRNNTQIRLFTNETIGAIATAHNKTPAQIILRWHLQFGNITIPGSSNPAHILENISIFDFELTDEEMQRMSALDTGIPSFDFSNVDDEPNFGSFRPNTNFNDQQ